MDVARRLGIPPEYKERSTINEHLEILAGQRPEDANAFPHMRYLVLGNKGHKASEVAPGVMAMMPVAHSPVDTAPWGINPIVLRDLDDDLPESVRDMFRLRRIEQVGDVRKIAYYAMVVDLSGVKVIDFLTTVKDGIKNVVEYNYTDSDLHPIPPSLPDFNYDNVDQVITADGKYANASATTLVTLDAFVLGELMNVARLKYKTPLGAVVSEWCLCSGVDTVARGESFVGSSEIFYKEVIGCQVNMYISQYGNAADHSEKMELNVNVAQTTPYPIYSGIPSAQMQTMRRG
ncbi:MAG: DUF7208 family protein [Clostridium sp.]